jgi:hypothetical protein
MGGTTATDALVVVCGGIENRRWWSITKKFLCSAGDAESGNTQLFEVASITNPSASVIIGLSGPMNDLRPMIRQTRIG